MSSWKPIEDAPKDGSWIRVDVPTYYRWLEYKPEGRRQMKKPGRWQVQVWRGDFFKWENCEPPCGEWKLVPKTLGGKP